MCGSVCLRFFFFFLHAHTQTKSTHAHAQTTQHKLSRGSKNRSTSSTSTTPATTDGSTRGPQTAAPPPRRRAAGRTETAHTRRRAPRSRTPQTGRGTAPRRPARRPTRPRRRGHRRAPPVARRMQRPLVVQVQPLERRADPTLRRPHSPVPVPRPQIDQRPCAHGAPSRAPTQRSTPDAGRERAQPARLVVPVRVRHELAPQRRAQVRPHLPGEAGARGAHERAPALRAAPPREARERGRGAGRGAGGGGARGGQAEGGRWRGRGHRLSRWSGTRARRWWTRRVGARGRGHARRWRGAPRPLARM